MKKTLFTIAAAVAVSAAVLTVAGPASADDPYLCMTTENAPFYAGIDSTGGVSYLFTLSAGRGFRTNGHFLNDALGRDWMSGHGAEHPDREGWVLLDHTNCNS